MGEGLLFLVGGGSLGELVRTHDWASTPLGSLEGWPQSLRTAVQIMLASGHAMCLAWGPEHVLLYNDAYAPLLGARHPAALGQRFAEAWPDVWDEIAPLVARTFAGETLTLQDMPLVMTRNGYPEDTWWTFSYSPVRDEAGTVAGLLNVTLETTARMKTEQKRDTAVGDMHMMNGELAHRLKNVLSVVQSVAQQTLRTAPDMPAASRALSSRLVALGTATDVLTSRSWRAADLRELAERALAPHGSIGERIRLDGPPVMLKPEVGMAFALALHELATNACKYGALANEMGWVTLAWSIERDADESAFALRWTEQGGPPVVPPQRTGFGSALIQRSLGAYFRGEAATDYHPDGLVFRLDARLRDAIVETGK